MENSYYLVKRLERKDLLLLANKLIEKIPYLRNPKKHYQSFLRKKSSKISKTIKNNYLSTKNILKPKH